MVADLFIALMGLIGGAFFVFTIQAFRALQRYNKAINETIPNHPTTKSK